ncbi:ALQxL family class IV lanthipeptide [Kitasatospora azatica]|nr:ALQxL family class IV lanthipeptide [Kitasatospora azatica]
MEFDLNALQELPAEDEQAGFCRFTCSLSCSGTCQSTCLATGNR